VANFFFEKIDSRPANVAVGPEQQTRTLRYRFGGSDDDVAMRLYIQANLLAYYDTLRFSNYKMEPLGNGLWDVEAIYGYKRIGLIKFSFDTTGTKTKIKQSLKSTYYPQIGEPQIDFQGAIEVSRTGGTVKVEGVEIIVPDFAFTVSRTFAPPYAPLDQATVQQFYNKSGTVNNDVIDVVINGVILHFDPGTLLFHGATGSQSSGGVNFGIGASDWEGEVLLKFGFSANLLNATIGGITGVFKDGWDYLWVSYEDEEDDTADVLIQSVRQVCVEQVYPRDAHAPLFFGGDPNQGP